MSIAEELIEKGRRERREEARRAGWQVGILIGRVQILEELSGLPASPSAELASKPVEELEKLACELKGRLVLRRAEWGLQPQPRPTVSA